jgi:phosphatidylglycerophosphate synthase
MNDVSVPASPSAQETYGQIVARLAATAGKSNRGAPGYTRWVNRPLGRRVAAVAFLRGMTPNQLTALNALLIFPTLLLIALVEPRWWWNVLAGLLLLAGYVLDSADGQLARLRGGGSKAGEWLDHVADAVKTGMAHAVLVVAWYRFYDLDPVWLLVPLAFGVVHFVYYFSLMLADDLRRLAKVERGDPRPSVPASSEPAPVIRSFIMLPNDWGVLCLVLMLLPVQWLFVTAYSLLLAANALFVLAGWVRWYRELVTL